MFADDLLLSAPLQKTFKDLSQIQNILRKLETELPKNT